ncbi:MAG: hypothetical protein AB8B65_09805 [Kordia sp.]|uniref:hypothetical protein n=1 Tax=Kordia sp. TaxID=1965332 RepID=UPI00385A5A60
MKKIVFLFLITCTFFSCDDGDLTLEEIDLTTDAVVQACVEEAGVTLLFKINGAETLILEVPNDLIINEATEDADTPRVEELNGAANCYYRSFDTNITSSYFCDELPSDIAVVLEYTAASGDVEVITTEVLVDGVVTEYQHTILLTNVVFTGTNGQDVRYNEFPYGTIETPAE